MAGTGEAISRSDRTHQTPFHLSCLELGRDKTQAQLSLHLWGLPECLNLSGLDPRGASSPGPATDGSQRSNLEPEQCGQGGYTRLAISILKRKQRRHTDGKQAHEKVLNISNYSCYCCFVTNLCLILGSGDSGPWCFSSWPSIFLSVPFILWLICATSTLLPPSSLWKHLPNPFCPTSAFQSNHFISSPPSACWGFLRGLRNLRAST